MHFGEQFHHFLLGDKVGRFWQGCFILHLASAGIELNKQ
jgi:hypothetical protein